MEWIEPLAGWLFVLTLAFNLRAVWKLAVDWRGMLTTVAFVRTAYACRDALPTEEAIQENPLAPLFLTLLAAYEEPGIATTLRTLLDTRYPHDKMRVVVVTKAAEDEAPHPAMPESTGALCRRFLADLPAYDAKRLTHLVMTGPGRKAEQLNWALRPEVLQTVLDVHALDPSRVFVGVGLALLVAVAVFGDRGVLQLWRLRTELETLHHDVATLEAENARLSHAIADLRDNPAVIERIAREELGLVRPGERVLRFPRRPRPGEPAGTVAPNFPRSP